jgi:uncharacterized coiled-coil protein SlyX
MIRCSKVGSDFGTFIDAFQHRICAKLSALVALHANTYQKHRRELRKLW